MDDTVITLDVDWAPDFIIDAAAAILKQYQTKATWFITHDSDAVQRLMAQPELFEIGVHPNFLPSSTQGKDTHEVMKYLMKIAPGAGSVRTHGMVYSAAISRVFAVDYGLKVDSSIFLGGMPHIIPIPIHYGNKVLLRLPYYWSDDGEMSIKPEPSFRPEDLHLEKPGLKALCFHPVHICLNSKDMSGYNRLKARCDISKCREKEARTFINEGDGAGTLLKEIIKRNPNPGGFKTLTEVAAEWENRDSK